MNPDLIKILIEPETLSSKAILKYNDNTEKVFELNDLRYRLGNCSEFQEKEDAYRLAINYLTVINSFLRKKQIEFANYIVVRYNSWYEKNKYVPESPTIIS